MTEIGDLLQALFAEILDEADSNPSFAMRLERILNARETRPIASTARQPGEGKRTARRSPGAIDPFAFYKQGPEALNLALAKLDIEQLKDIVAEHGMDNAKLAMKWKTRDRLEKLIVGTVAARSRKGEAFRTSSRNGPGDALSSSFEKGQRSTATRSDAPDDLYREDVTCGE